MSGEPIARGAGGTGRWIAVDWLEPSPRAWVVDDDGARQIAPSSPPPGADPEARLRALIGGDLDGATPVLCCGAADGWNDAPPPTVPATITGQSTPADVPGLALRFLPGLAQADPPDLMQGEETRIAGFIAAHPDWDGVLCLPGARSVWAQISAGEVVSFRSFLTGEIATLLREHSSLRNALGSPGDWNGAVFRATLGDVMSRPERVAGALASMRVDTAHAEPRLWGMLIGQELAATRAYWLGQRVALIGAPPMTARYATALGAQGVNAEIEDGCAMALGGLIAARAQAAPEPHTPASETP